ncbi:MAG: AAA family ATPase [Dehalococcoidia bacterium]
MAAPDTRMGFKQASGHLRKFGYRPCRTAQCPKLGGFQVKLFAAVKLKKGLTDSEVVLSDLKHEAETMTDLVEVVKDREASRLADSGNFDNAGQSGIEDKPPEPEPSPLTDGKPTEAEKRRDVNDAAAKLKALQDLLGGGGVDETKVRAMIIDVAGDAIRSAAGNTVALLEDLTQGIKNEIGQAVKAAAGLIPVRIEIKVRDRVKPVEGQHKSFPVLLEEMALGQSVFMSGPAGSGKTTGCIEACKILERPFYIMRAVQDPFELLGFIDANGVYQESPIYRWAMDKGSVLIMDEMDRSNPKALIALNAVWNGVATFPTGQIEIPEDNLIVATANTWGTGADAEYVGSSRLDAATLNRFPSRIDWGYDLGLETRIAVANGGDAEESRYAQGIRVKLNAKKIRVIWSPRDTVAHCKRVASGMPREESIRRSVLCGLDPKQLSEVSS